MFGNYCEQNAIGILKEPFNIISSLFIIITVFALLRLIKNLQMHQKFPKIFTYYLLSILVGCILNHSFNGNWSIAIDVSIIFIFQLIYYFTYYKHVIKMPIKSIISIIVLFICINLFAVLYFSHISQLLIHLPTLLFLLIAGLYHYYTQKREKYLLLIATFLQGIAIIFWHIDLNVCQIFPIGTHFLWHITTAISLYFIMRALLKNYQ